MILAEEIRVSATRHTFTSEYLRNEGGQYRNSEGK